MRNGINSTRSPFKKVRKPQRRGRSPLILILLILLWCLILGWGLAQATETSSKPFLLAQQPSTNQSTGSLIGTVDPVPKRYQLGQELYLENCATCHIGVPPAVLPLETWKQLLLDRQHYGVQVKPLVDPSRLLVWDYLRTFSRPHKEGEETPYRIADSRYFKALHPRVKVPRPVKLANCATCHTGAAQYNFRSLTAEWQNSP